MRLEHKDSILHPTILMIAKNNRSASTQKLNKNNMTFESEQDFHLVTNNMKQSTKNKQTRFKNHEFNSFKLNKGRPPVFPKISKFKVAQIEQGIDEDMKNRYNKSTAGVHKSMNNLFDNPGIPISRELSIAKLI